jgi:hypothetical protein
MRLMSRLMPRLVPRLVLPALLVGLAATGLPARAETLRDRAEFSVEVRGITAGTLSFDATQTGARYKVSGTLASGGLAAFLRKVRYDARAEGRIRGGRYVPSSYVETADTGKRRSEATMGFAGGVPQVKVYKPAREPRPFDIDPATQGGSVDPLTAMYATLRDVAADQACKVDLKLFDGRRASRVTLSDPVAEGERIICRGEYRRVAGFSAEDMAEKTRFAFTVTFAPAAGDRLQATEVAMDTLFGRARMVRQ